MKLLAKILSLHNSELGRFFVYCSSNRNTQVGECMLKGLFRSGKLLVGTPVPVPFSPTESKKTSKLADQMNIQRKNVYNSRQQALNLATLPTFHTTFSELLFQVDHNYRLNMSTLRYFLQMHSVLWIRILNFGPIWMHNPMAILSIIERLKWKQVLKENFL